MLFFGERVIRFSYHESGTYQKGDHCVTMTPLPLCQLILACANRVASRYGEPLLQESICSYGLKLIQVQVSFYHAYGFLESCTAF